MALTYKNKLYADHYLITLNGTESARVAGYKGTNRELSVRSAELLRKPEIKEYIENSLSKKSDDLIIKQNDVLKFLSDCIRGTVTEESYYNLKKGNKGTFEENLIKKDLTIRIRDRIKACEIMAKYYKLYDSDETKNNKVYIIDDINDIPNEETEEIIN